jgi:hypothetical protein
MATDETATDDRTAREDAASRRDDDATQPASADPSDELSGPDSAEGDTSSGDTGSEDASDDATNDLDDEDTPRDSGEDVSQEELARRAEEEKEKQYAESRRKVGPIVLAASIVLGAIGLITMYLGTSVTGNHPLSQNGMLVVGLVNLVLALAIYIRKNGPRAVVLTAMPITIVLVLLTSTVVPVGGVIAVVVLCIAEIYLMFRQPVLDEYDAPKE